MYLFFQVFLSKISVKLEGVQISILKSIYKTPSLNKNCFLKMLIPCWLLENKSLVVAPENEVRRDGGMFSK